MTNMQQIDAHREARYAEMIADGIDLSNTYTTQEGDVYSMDGSTCPRCAAAAKLSTRIKPSGYFVCRECDLLFDEPNFDCDEFITNVDDED